MGELCPYIFCFLGKGLVLFFGGHFFLFGSSCRKQKQIFKKIMDAFSRLDKLTNSILFCVTTLDCAGQCLSTNCQLAAINSQTCLLESPGGLRTLDVAPINWLREIPQKDLALYGLL